MSLYLVNHTMREFETIDTISDIITVYNDMLNPISHGDIPDWRKDDFIEVIAESDLNKFKKLWEINDVEELIKHLRERNQAKFCCHADGYLNACCEAGHVVNVLTYQVSRRPYYQEYLKQYHDNHSECQCKINRQIWGEDMKAQITALRGRIHIHTI